MTQIKNLPIECNSKTIKRLNEMIIALRKQNPLINLKVDYWLKKNEDILRPLGKKFWDDREKMTLKYIESKNVNDVSFLILTGKDDMDVILSNRYGFFKEFEIDGKPELKQLGYDEKGKPVDIFWEREMIADKEGEEPIKIKVPYQYKWKNAEAEQGLSDEMNIQEEQKHSLSLYRLEEKYLDSVKIAWPDPNDPNNNADDIRNLLYENLIIHEPHQN